MLKQSNKYIESETLLNIPDFVSDNSRPIQQLRIAVQKSGRLNQASMSFLESLGLTFAANDSSLTLKCTNFNLSVLLVRDDDIPEFVSRGVADFGIVGQNVLNESGTKTETIAQLDFGICRLVVAAPINSDIKTVGDLEGKRIATTYPELLRSYLKNNNINATIISIAGSVEIAPELDLADAICDITQSGTTLKVHNLAPIATIMDSQAVFIGSSLEKTDKQKFLQLIKP